MRRIATLVAGITLTAVAACGTTSPASTGPQGSTAPGAVAGLGAAPTSAVTPSAAPSSAAVPAGCPMFPADNVWRADVSKLPVHRSSASYVASIGASATMHPDFGSGTYGGGPIGIPVTTVPAGQAGARVTFQYAGESDKGPYPIPRNALIEGGPNADGDRHIILHDPARCRLYELFAAYPQADGSWKAGSGAIYDLRSNKLRPRGWTSADAAGLPILPGLVRYPEVAAGRIDHAIRITAPRTRDAYVWPARHAASSSSDPALPPMGLRLRLKSTVDVSRFPAQARVVAQAMQRYGVVLADNGSPWFISGAPDERWDNGALRALKSLRGSDFEAIDTSGLMVSPDSAACRRP